MNDCNLTWSYKSLGKSKKCHIWIPVIVQGYLKIAAKIQKVIYESL